MSIIATLVIIHKHPYVLLGMKKRGFGKGRFNGFGGKVEKNESIEEAARRELWEEIGVRAPLLDKVGLLQFSFEDKKQIPIECHVFKVTSYNGEPCETEEMKPKWFHESDIPYGSMWPDDKEWTPLFLRGEKFHGIFHFRDHNTVLRGELHKLP